jgi:hypothetical protein
MKKIFMAVIAGILCVVAACNDDASVSPAEEGTKTVKQDTVPVAPQPADTVVVVPGDTTVVVPAPTDTTVVVPGDTTVVTPPYVPERHPSSFPQSDLDLIASLKAMIPSDVLSGFEARYTAWKITWTIPGVGSAYIRSFAESEEYEDLLQYCKRYGKASWPLFMDKLGEGDVFVGNLLEDLTYTGEGTLSAYAMARYFPAETRKHWPSTNELLIAYSKELLAQELENIKKSIQEITN